MSQNKKLKTSTNKKLQGKAERELKKLNTDRQDQNKLEMDMHQNVKIAERRMVRKTHIFNPEETHTQESD